MPVFKNPIAQRCARWILLATSPAPLPMLHPVRDDMAAAVDEIERLGKILLGACQRAKHCQHPAGCVCDIDPTTMHFPDQDRGATSSAPGASAPVQPPREQSPSDPPSPRGRHPCA